MRIGEEREFIQQQDFYSHDCMFTDGAYFHRDLFDFVKTQYARFNVEPLSAGIIETIARIVYDTMTYNDPYCWLDTYSDLQMTSQWKHCTYEIVDVDGNVVEAQPENMETFKYVPGQALDMFNQILSKPSLQALPGYLGELIQDSFNGEMTGECIWNVLDEHQREELKQKSTTETGYHQENFNAYIDLTAWAIVAWLLGPPGEQFRIENIYVFSVCLEYGECIVYEGNIYSPESYKVYNRPPQSCVICGLDAWCVEMVYIGGIARFMCEHHVNGARSEGVRCGTKICRHVECPNHPLAGRGLKTIDLMRYHTRKELDGHQQGVVEWGGEKSAPF